jgi:hypothetical protein
LSTACFFHILDQGHIIGGFCRRKLTRRDRFSNDFRMAIATGLFVLLASCFVGFMFGIKSKLRGGFRRRKLSRLDRFSNDFRVAIATGLFVLLA